MLAKKTKNGVKHGCTAYADDTQLHVSFRPDSSAAQYQAIKAIENYIADVRAW